MRLVRLVLVNIKRQIKNPLILLMTLIMPVVILFIVNSDGFSGSLGDIGFIDKSQSEYSAELIDELNKKYSVKILEGEVEKKFNLLREQKLGAIYVIESDFEEVLSQGISPNIKCYQTESTNGSIMANNIINEYISKFIEEGISSGLSTNSIVAVIDDKDVINKDYYKINIIMICYFMMIGGAIIAEEILKLKKQKVLRRTIATSNSDIEILGSLFISSFLIQGILSSLAFIILIFLIDIPNSNIFQGILVLFLGSLISTSVIVALTRWIKNESLASVITVSFSLLTFGVSILASNLEGFENIPSVVSKLAILSPFTWLLKIIETNDIIVSILVIVLMSAVFFTAGSFRLREFVKE